MGTLGKLLKYEWKETRRIMPWFFLGTALSGLLALLVTWIDIPGVKTVAQILLALMGVGTFFVALVIIVLRFYRSMFGAEGYLSQTLPVSAGKLVLTKFISGVVWTGLAAVAMLAALLETVMLAFNLSGADVWAFFTTPIEMLPMNDGSVLYVNSLAEFSWPMILLSVAAGVFYLVQIYLAITLSSTPPFNSSPVLAIPYFLIINFVAGIVDGLLMLFLPLQITFGEGGWSFGFEPMISWMLSLPAEEITSMSFGLGQLIFDVAATVGVLGLIVYLVRRKVNVK